MILSLFRRRPEAEAASRIYPLVVEQGRAAAFYSDLAVPDTVEGRFEMVALHAFLYFHRLKAEGEAARAVGQEVFDLMFRETDSALREIGVGDLTVPKKIKAMAQGFYGRIAAYDAALAADGDEPLTRALARNVHGDQAFAGPEPARLAAYTRRAVAALAAQPIDELVSSGPAFPPVVEIAL